MKRTSHSYYVVMQDFGRPGLEATVHPEETRRDVVARIKSGDYKNIVFIHHVDGLYIYDCTAELFEEAGLDFDAPLSPADRQAAEIDHARDLLKHEVA